MKSLFVVAAVMLSFGCKRDNADAVSTVLPETRQSAATAAATPKEIIICDQKNARIVMVDIANGNAITWEWKANASYAMIHTAAEAWFSNLSDAKLVYNGTYVLATASGGGVALIKVSTKKAVWYDYAGGNTHSAELLPNGNVVTASSTGGYLRIFSVDSYINDQSAQTGPIAFEDVHNVVWDHQRQVLYAAGKNKLKKFSYNGSCMSPSLTLLATYTLPQGNAHDLFPVHGSTTELWLSNSNYVYKFNVVTGTFTLVKTLSKVKSVTSGPAGYQTIVAVANGNGGETWRTDRVTDLATGSAVYTNSSFGLYKARWKLVNAFSYPAGDSYHECTH